MLDIFFETERLKISPLSKTNYGNVTKLYADVKNNSFATIASDKTTEKEVENKTQFDSKIRSGFNLIAETKITKEFVGYLKGYVSKGKNNENILWINILVIERNFREKHYGTELISALFDYLKHNYFIKFAYVSVLDENKTAKYFWESLSFRLRKTLMKSVFDESQVSKINIFVKDF